MIWLLVALGGGVGSFWMSNKSKGRNAQKAFKYAAWGFLLLILPLISFRFLLPFPLFFLDFWIVKMIPSILLFLAAGNSILKEMRAQQQSDYTEAARQ